MSKRHMPHAAMTFLYVLAFYTIVGGQTSVLDRDPRMGTWKLNLEKSQFFPGIGPQAPKMQWRRLETRPDGFIVFTQSGLDGQSNPIFAQTTYKLDGKSYLEYTQASLSEFSATGTQPSANTYKLIDANTVEITRMDIAGKVTATSTQVMTKNGKTHTSTGRDTSGKVLFIQLWDKQ